MFTIQPFKSGGQSRPVVSCSFNREGDLALTSSIDGTTLLWHIDPSSSEVVRVVGRYRQNSAMRWSAFSPSSRYVAIATMDGNVRIYHTLTGILVAILDHTPFKGFCMAGVEFSYDGRFLFTYSTSLRFEVSYVHAWNVSGLSKQEVLDNIEAQNKIIMQADPQQLVYGTNFGVNGPYALPDAQLVKVPYITCSSERDESEEITAMCVAPGRVDSETLVMIGTKSSEICLYSFKESSNDPGSYYFNFEDEYNIDYGVIKDITYCESTNVFTVASRNGQVDVFGLVLGKYLKLENIRSLKTSFECNSAVQNPKNDAIIAYVGGMDAKDVTTTAQTTNTFKICFIDAIHSVEMGNGIDGNNYHIGTVHRIRFSPDGLMALSVSEDGASFFWKFTNEIISYKFDYNLLD